MKKDYWDICKRICVAIAILDSMVLFFVIFSPQKPTILFVILITNLVVWLVLGRLFNKRVYKAIIFSYIFLGLILLLFLANLILRPLSFDASSILVFLVYIYILQCVYQASKQKTKLQ